MSITTINQSWHNQHAEGDERTWTVTLTVSAVDLTGDEVAALAPVAEAIETYVDMLRDSEEDR